MSAGVERVGDAAVRGPAFERLLTLVGSKRAQLLSMRQRSQDEGPTAEAVLLDRIGEWLYETWYAVPDPPAPAPATWVVPEMLVSALRASVPAATLWERGWAVIRSDAGGGCVAGRRGHVRELRPGDYANLSRPGMPVMPGDGVAVTTRLDGVDTPSGFWSTRPAAGEPQPPLVRVYWSVDWWWAGGVLRRVAGVLDALNARYSAKCPASPSAYSRVDSLVVYLERAAWPVLARSIEAVAREAASMLRSSCPPLTLQIAPGVAFAEDPGPAFSFGQSRCRAIAPAILALLDQPPVAPAAALEVLVGALKAASIDPDRPWVCTVQ